MFQNNVASQVLPVVVTVHPEEAIPAGMEFLSSAGSAGSRSWIGWRWRDSWGRPVSGGLVFWVGGKGTAKSSRSCPRASRGVTVCMTPIPASVCFDSTAAL